MKLLRRILIIEDDPHIGSILKIGLTVEKFEIQIQDDGREGIKQAKTFRPDLVLLDLIMPKADGVTVLKLFKADPELANIPIVIVSAKADEAQRQLVRDLGASDFLVKPFHLNDLMTLIDEWTEL